MNSIPERIAQVTASSQQRRMRRRRGGLARMRAIWGVFFVTPLIIGLVVFSYGPALAGLGLSLTQYDALNPPKWVGLANFRSVLTWDLTGIAFRNTVVYTVGFLVLGIPSAFALSLTLNQKVRGIMFYRTIYFLPAVTSGVGIMLLWRWMYSTDFGVINFFLGLLGLPAIPWLSSEKWALPSMIFMSVWGSLGYNAFMFLAALQGVPEEYYDAARIDGASPWQRLWGITLPLISPTTFFVVVTTAISCFQVFTQMYVMTEGGPGYATTPVVLLIYKRAFRDLKFGQASALALLLFVVIMALSIVQFRLQEQWVHYEL